MHASGAAHHLSNAIYGWLTGRQRRGNREAVPDESPLEQELARLLGERLQALRRAKGLSQEAFAHQAGLSRNHYQLLEAGLSHREPRRPANPRLGTLRSIAAALEISPSQLVAELVPDDEPGPRAAITDGGGGHHIADVSASARRHRR